MHDLPAMHTVHRILLVEDNSDHAELIVQAAGGLEMARQFTSAGNQVIITGRNENALSVAADAVSNLSTIQSDAGASEQIQSLKNRVHTEFPDTNIVINNAGIMWSVNLQDHQIPLDKLTGEIDINLKGPIHLKRLSKPVENMYRSTAK